MPRTKPIYFSLIDNALNQSIDIQRNKINEFSGDILW